MKFLFDRVIRCVELYLALFAFLLNFVWELLQLPLFTGLDDAHHYDVILHCTWATLGDVVISLCAFYSACLFRGTRSWIIDSDNSGLVAFFAMGLLITVIFELLATGPLNRWEYSSLMPMIPFIHVGISPIIQWLVIPFIQLWIVRRMLLSYR
jgi:hypothetical protein